MRIFWSVLKWTAFLLLALFVLSAFGLEFLIGIPFMLAFGWIRFLHDNISAMQVNPLLLAEAGVCVVLLGLGSHWFARWLYGQMSPAAPVTWRPGWTIAGLGGVLLLFVAGIAIIGITHQAAWLFTAKGPLLTDGWSDRARVSEVILMSGEARTAVAETYGKTGKLPATDVEAGLTAPRQPTRLAKSISVGPEGVVRIEVAEIIAGGGVITFTPTAEGAKVTWTCRSTLPPRLLPAECREPGTPEKS